MTQTWTRIQEKTADDYKIQIIWRGKYCDWMNVIWIKINCELQPQSFPRTKRERRQDADREEEDFYSSCITIVWMRLWVMCDWQLVFFTSSCLWAETTGLQQDTLSSSVCVIHCRCGSTSWRIKGKIVRLLRLLLNLIDLISQFGFSFHRLRDMIN